MTDPTRLLIVEDDQYLITLFKFALQTRGADFEIFTAGDGAAALSLARDTRPDLILLDIMLPGDVDGVEVCRQIRRDPAMRGVGVVMVTALEDPATRQAAIEAGAADYWTKPISARHLQERVRAVLNLKRPATIRSGAAGPIGPSEAAAPPAREAAPGLESAVAAIRRTYTQLEPSDWAEIQALADARLNYRKAGKA